MAEGGMHIGIIMDGNRRWAKEQGKSAIAGHKAGYKTLKLILNHLKEQDEVKSVTIYAFSNENWRRPTIEVKGLMKLALYVLDKELDEFLESGARLRVLGSKEGLPKSVAEGIKKAEKLSAKNTKYNLNVCFNYGGRKEIVDATRKAIESGISPEDITEESLGQFMYQPEVSDVDLVIRTSGELRTSGFMTWRSVYSELYFVDKYWPDFTVDDLNLAIAEYNSRQRRKGA